MISVTLKKKSFSALKQQIILKPLSCVQYGQVLGLWAETESNRYCDTCIAIIKMLDLCSCVLFGKTILYFSHENMQDLSMVCFKPAFSFQLFLRLWPKFSVREAWEMEAVLFQSAKLIVKLCRIISYLLIIMEIAYTLFCF